MQEGFPTPPPRWQCPRVLQGLRGRERYRYSQAIVAGTRPDLGPCKETHGSWHEYMVLKLKSFTHEKDPCNQVKINMQARSFTHFDRILPGYWNWGRNHWTISVMANKSKSHKHMRYWTKSLEKYTSCQLVDELWWFRACFQKVIQKVWKMIWLYNALYLICGVLG